MLPARLGGPAFFEGMGEFLPEVGQRVPRLRARLPAPLARALLRLAGWRVSGTLPDLPKLIILAAPHSSLWDGVGGIGAALALRTPRPLARQA
ncbi:MAG: hypothetical protein RML12_00940 [Xanthomonadales bacterium]|nr:hypothetical protein [Xanthomonadales bacterium]